MLGLTVRDIAVTVSDEKREMLELGVSLMRRFCNVNLLLSPEIVVVPVDRWRFGKVCAYYDESPARIVICLEKCARLGRAGREWSWPGYVVDREPYGVLAHELGHHVDWTLSDKDKRGRFLGDFSWNAYHRVQEDGITSYGSRSRDGERSNAHEWFAEILRLFVTNPALLNLIRPKAFEYLIESAHLTPIVTPDWREAILELPERQVAAAANKISQAEKKRNRQQ